LFHQYKKIEREKRMSRPTHYVFTAVLCLLACTLYYIFFINTAHVEVELEVANKTSFKIYWAEKGQPYSEKHMSVVIAHPGRSHYSFFLTNIKNIARLRIDTHDYAGEATLRHLRVEQEGYVALTLSNSREFGKLVPLAQIEDFRITDDGVWLRSTGKDPNFELPVIPEYPGMEIGWLIIRFGAIIFFVILISRFTFCLGRDFLFVPVLLTGVWVLIIVMAGISERNVHPDEYVHLYASSYYVDHWLPPALDDESVRNSYSVYGLSRLNNREIYYLFSGKFLKLLESFRIPEYFSMRMFNICLFGLILLYTMKSRYARMVAIPFLLSSQIWYVFSYCGSDAFALFITFLVSCELITPNSLLNRFLTGERRRFLLGIVVLGFLFGCLFLLKINYYPFIAFIYLFLGIQLFFNTSSSVERKTGLKRLTAITITGLLLFGLQSAEGYVVNGFDRNTRIAELREELAHPSYKPSTDLDKKHISLYRKARGITLAEMVTVGRWFDKSFKSSFGVFGYFTISASQTYYDLVRWTGVGLLIFVFGSIFFRGGLENSSLAFSLIVLSGALISVALYRSWTVDFQAQGRYFFSIVPMLGILYVRTYRVIHRQILFFGVCAMYLLGMYSFIFQSLIRIPKIVFH
jgi:hypothetical protein